MPIRKLPDYVINRLKAGEVVDRPASIIKELVENSIDAGAKYIDISIVDGGKSRIRIQDDGSGISPHDAELVFERYATSKIQSDDDLLTLKSYGFRGEALASISEVAKVLITTKKADMPIGMQIHKRGEQIYVKSMPVDFEHGSIIMVEDLFFNVPARQKFLKSGQTEFYYCYNYITDIALGRTDISLYFSKNDKLIHELPVRSSLLERVEDVFKKDRSQHMRPLSYVDDRVRLEGVVADSSLRFGSAEYIKIYVNNRPVQDKIIKKAIMQAYHRQITPGEFPFAIVFITLSGEHVDVNVHPSKLHVKFSDSQHIYNTVLHTIVQALSENKISSARVYTAGYIKPNISPAVIFAPSSNLTHTHDMSTLIVDSISSSISSSVHISGEHTSHMPEDMRVVGQLWDMYIVLQSQDALYYVDQHALAERIAFEKMKKEKNLTPEIVLNPIRVSIVSRADRDEKIQQLQQLGFDCSLLGENSLVVYAIPYVFVQHPVDLEHVLQQVMDLDNISFDTILDTVFAMKACKISIKAGDTLSIPEMKQLIHDGFIHIPSMFVCQHGRPFFLKIPKKDIDALVDR